MVKLFISYSDADGRDLAEKLKMSLEDLDTDTFAFVAAEDIDVGVSWEPEIINALNDCDVFIPILTVAACRSNWVQKEIGVAIEKKKRTIPCVYNQVLSSMIPGIIEGLQRITFRSEYDLTRQVLALFSALFETAKTKKFELSLKNHSDVTIEDWQAYFLQLYSERNTDLTRQFMWLKVIEKATIVGEAIRKKNFNEASRSIARLFCWLCGFCSKNGAIIGTDKLSEIIWYKYPRVCSTCAVEINKELIEEIESKTALKCRCDRLVEYRVNKKLNNELLGMYRGLNKPIRLDDWVKMFEAIYGHRLQNQSLDSICFHFLEEVGEVTTALRNYRENEINIDPENVDRNKLVQIMDMVRGDNVEYELLKTRKMNDREFFDECKKLMKNSIKEEVADVFSWLSALVIKLLENRSYYTEYESRFFITLFPKESLDTIQPSYIREGKPLNLSSMVYLEYAHGCPVCENLRKGKERCLCETKMASTII